MINTPSLGDLFANVASADPEDAIRSAFDAGVLADNGGAVQTVAIKDGGVAHNAGDARRPPIYDHDGESGTPAVADPDRRARPCRALLARSVDIGAFERRRRRPRGHHAGRRGVRRRQPCRRVADGGGLSLREALAFADLSPSTHDTIQFALALTTGFVDGVDNGHLYVDNGELTIASDVTIDGDVDGDGKADITLDAD